MEPSILYWDDGCWSSGAQKSVVIAKRPASGRWELLEVFLQGQHTEVVVQGSQVTSQAGSNTNDLPRVTGYGGVRESWKASS